MNEYEDYDDLDDEELTPEEQLTDAVRDVFFDMLKALRTPAATHAILLMCVTPRDDPRVFPAMAKALGVAA